MEHTSKRWLESTDKRRKSAGTATPFGRVFDEPGLAVDHVVTLLADDFALAIFDRGAFVGHEDLLPLSGFSAPLRHSFLIAGRRTTRVVCPDKANVVLGILNDATLPCMCVHTVHRRSALARTHAAGFLAFGHDSLLSATLLRVGAAGLRALDVAGLDELHRSVDGLVQAALATGRGLGVDAVVTGDFPSFFRSCHDITSRCFGSFRYSSLVVSVFRLQSLNTIIAISTSNGP